MIFFDVDGPFIKGILAFQSLTNLQRNLIGAVDVKGGMIHEEGTVSVFVLLGFFALCIAKMTVSARHVLVDNLVQHKFLINCEHLCNDNHTIM